jgi:serine/threonine-protein kinase
VPKLRGLPLEKARARLKQAQLRLGQVTERADANARRGTVIGQQPGPRTQVRPGTAVDLVIAGRQSNQPVVGASVPKLRGLPLKKARAKLKQAQLRLGKVTERADGNARRGTVIGQEPAPKRQVKPGTAVDVVVAGASQEQQPNAVEVPDLVGKNAIIVGALLERAGLKLGRMRRETKDDGKRNTVLEQMPRSGTLVQPGTAVDLVILKTRDK